MIAARDVLERRLLAALEQAVVVTLPEHWKGLDIDKGKRRSAAAVLLALADHASRQEMLAELDRIGMQAKTRAEQRGRASDEEGKEPPEVKLWRDLHAAIEAVTRRRDELEAGESKIDGGAVPLRQLAVWHHIGDPFQRICAPFRGSVLLEEPASEPVAGEIARILLRAKARVWMDEDRNSRKQQGPEDES
jgi:hypothetical protein